MKIRFEAKLNISLGAVAPDAWFESSDPVPHNEFIVSRDRHGIPKSLYGDLVWDFSAYNPEGKVVKLIFNFWGKGQPSTSQLALTSEMKRVFFSLIWRREGAPLSSGTLANYMSVLAALANCADSVSSSISSILDNEEKLLDFVSTHCSGWMAEMVLSLVAHIAKFSSVALGFNVVNDKCVNRLKKHNKNYRAGIKQYPPMPTRIYLKLITGLIDELEKWKSVSVDILDAARYCAQDPRAGRSPEWQRQISTEQHIQHLRFFPLEEILSEESIKYIEGQGKPIEVNSLSSIIGQIQYNAKMLIQIFSGMRDDEVNTLPYYCSANSNSNGITHFIIKGRTTKFAHGLAVRSQWITNCEGHDAIKTAQAIADAIYDICDAIPEPEQSRINHYPLFVSVGYFGFVGKKPGLSTSDFSQGTMMHRELPPTCVSIIENEDLLELEQIDPHRAWRSEEKFQLGRTWTFTSHQTRRSLALYAQRSGLVSLPSLRRQLKHITDEMARYYAKGSAFAQDFIGGDTNHFGVEWQATQAESSALSYILNVLMSEDVLFGAHTQWIHQRLNKPEGLILMDRSVTLKRFKKGELAYKETILGGCTNLGACDKVAVRWLHTACVTDNCKNLVGNLPKLELVIKAQETMIQRLDHSSVEYRTELEDLQSLVEIRDRVQSNKKGIT